MKPKKEITFLIEGLSEEDKEKLLSVLVLAEVRLDASWIYLEQADSADVCFSGGSEDQKPNIQAHAWVLYGKAESTEVFPRQGSELFCLRVDSNNVPFISDLICVLNQVFTWVERVSEQDSVEPEPEPEPEPELRSEVSASQPQMVIPDASLIPTLMPVDDDSLPTSEPAATGVVDESRGSNSKLPWLDAITHYLHSLDADAEYCKIVLQSGDILMIDFNQERYYSSIEVESFISKGRDNKVSCFSVQDKHEFKTGVSKQGYIERPLSNLKWFLALYSNVSSLDIDAESDAYVLGAWPGNELPGLHRDHLKLAAFMRAKRASLSEIAAETGIAIGQITSFVEACHHEGLLLDEPELETLQELAPEKPKGLWGRLLHKIRG
ncbi:hypothetical protein [Marinobacterium stanieri]|uniref:hypothetical protein n=1 Tax=Marinobacterium stanieri TaxID=49186 RepID=UPI003A915074